MFLKVISILGSLTFISRILWLRKRPINSKINWCRNGFRCFFISFKLPNLFRRLFAEGSMNSAFIPVISGIKNRFGKTKSDEFFHLFFFTFSLSFPPSYYC